MPEIRIAALARPILFHDNYRAKKGDCCTILKEVHTYDGLPKLIEIRFPDGVIEYVRKEDLEETE